MRHTVNHKGPESNCPACKDEEEFDKLRKLERRLMRTVKHGRTPEKNTNPAPWIEIKAIRKSK